MILKKHISQLLSYFLIFFSLTIRAQNTYLINPSLDGNDDEKTLPGWETCENTDPSDSVLDNNNPDFLDYYTDTVYKDTLYHKDGVNMCLLRTRGINNELVSRRGTYEHISTQLLSPFEKDSSYTMAIWLVHMHYVHIADLVDPDISFPLRFQVFGADGYCMANNADKLADTLVKNEEWEKYIFLMKPKRNYNYIYFRVYWDDSIKVTQNGTYSGFIFIDGADLTKTCKLHNEPTETVYFTPNRQLKAPDGSNWRWEPEEYLSNSTEQTTLLEEYVPDMPEIKVTVTDQNYCTFEKKYNIKFSCDTLYPNQIYNTYDVYYKTYEENVLRASAGESYHWYDPLSLSGIDTRSPVITNYQEQFKVTITDKYECDYDEVFNIHLDCEYLYNIPLTDSLSDTEEKYRETNRVITLGYGESSTLKPIMYDSLNLDISTISSFTWSPPDYLSCTDCYETLATPNEDQVYRVAYRDTFNCLFYDFIRIELGFGKIPNVITPGEMDGKNDIFRIPGLPENSAIEIYEKSGRMIYKSNHYSSPDWWNGTDMDGKPVRSGTYWYVLTTPINTKPIKGYVMVIR